MTSVALRHGLALEDPLATALAFLEAYGEPEPDASPSVFGPLDLRRANGGGARISAAEQAAVLARRAVIQRALDALPVRASLTSARVRWSALTRLFDAFGGIKGVGFSKVTKTLHPKRPALIPILDSVVCEYLAEPPRPDEPFAARATALVRSYKLDLDLNRAALSALRRELAARGYRVSEVRALDLLIWSAVQSGCSAV